MKSTFTINGNDVTLTEEQAMSLLYAFKREFDWSGTMFTRADAEQVWQELHDVDTRNLDEIIPFPDSVWHKVVFTYDWRRALPEILEERGWEIVEFAVREVLEQQ